jgi:integrase
MQEWRADEKAKLRLTRKQRAFVGSFEADARRYLNSVTALLTYKDRTRIIRIWMDEFGTRDRLSISSAEIRAIRDRWLTTPRELVKGKRAKRRVTKGPPLSPGTVNKRLRALSNLFRVLDGSHAYNPAADVEEAKEPAPIPRDLDYKTIKKILDALPDQGFSHKGKRRSAASLTKVRLRILAYTGLPASSLMRLTPQSVDVKRARLLLQGRQKGKGSPSVILPLLPQAVAAFQDLNRLKGWGRFSNSSVHSSFQRACKKVGLSGIRVYDLRHSFGTLAFDLTGSLEAVTAFLQHSSPQTTRRYTLRAQERVLADYLAKINRGLRS